MAECVLVGGVSLARDGLRLKIFRSGRKDVILEMMTCVNDGCTNTVRSTEGWHEKNKLLQGGAGSSFLES